MKHRILVIDDDAVIRRLLVRLLGGNGYEVLTAVDGEGGLAALEGAGAIDVIICDLCLPGISGIEVVRRVRSDRRWDAVPVLMLTGEGADETRGAALAGGADHYLTKPFSSYEMEDALRQLLASERRSAA